MVRTVLTILLCLAVSVPANAAPASRHTGGVQFAMGDGSVRDGDGTRGSLSAGQETTSCDCSNCSAEHCQPTGGGGGGDYALWQSNFGASD